MDQIKTPQSLLGSVSTRGEFRALSERAEQGRLRGSESLPDSSPIWDAWENLKAAYPTSTVNWDAEPPPIWCATLGDLSGEQLLNGLRNLRHHHDSRGGNDFPPNVAQFRDLCLTNFEWETRAHRQDFTGRAQIEDLTGKERRIAERKAQMAKLRQEVGL